MDLVNELQISAERDDVLTVLRKARRLASKLGVNDINDWLKAEQNGYGGTLPIPAYRKVKGFLVYKTNGPIPIGLGMLGNGIMDYPGGFSVDRTMGDAMGEVLALVESLTNGGRGLYTQLEDSGVLREFRDGFDPDFAHQITFMLRMNPSQVRAIPEAVKDKVLDWACELERRGVRGHDMTFNDQEKRDAHAITFNISNSTVEQLNNLGNNIREVPRG